MIRWLIPLLAGFLLDLCIGDPRWLYHPIRLVGALIALCERGIRRLLPRTKSGELLGGGLLVLLVASISTGVPAVLLHGAWKLHPVLGGMLETFWCFQLLATRSLRDESKKVYDRLSEGDLPGARKAVSMIVGRDTQNLDQAGVTKAAVETVAENTSDGIIAPMLFMALGGAALGFFYKSINTMDSMVGYKNERYRYFGRCAAKLDDLVNFIPARVSAWLMIGAAFLAGDSGKGALRVYRRDKGNHASPNSAHTEAVMAGALGIQLAGDALYFGTLYKKKTIGDPTRPVECEDILRAHRLLYVTALLAAGLSVLVMGGISWIC